MSIQVPPWVLIDKVTSLLSELTMTINGCPTEALSTKNWVCPGEMEPVTIPVVAFDKKLMRVASGGIKVAPTGGRVGISKVGVTKGVADGGTVAVFAGVIARIVAATMVSTALGTIVGMDVPMQAAVRTRVVIPTLKSCLDLTIQFSDSGVEFP